MNKMKKTGVRFLSVCLCLLLFFGVVPLQVFAAELRTSGTEQNETVLSDTAEQQAEILYEVPQKRDAYTKVYKKSDGSFTALLSSSPLHFQQDGAWVDIDNTLCASSLAGETVYTTTENSLQVTLPQTLSEESGIVLAENGRTISFALQDIRQSEAQLQEAQTQTQQIPQPLQVQSETAVYAEVFPDTQLSYSVHSDTVKENIVLETRQAVRAAYTFSVSAADMRWAFRKTGRRTRICARPWKLTVSRGMC